MTHSLETHEIDPATKYCKRCGEHAADVMVNSKICAATDNVIGISHILSAARRAEGGFRLS